MQKEIKHNLTYGLLLFSFVSVAALGGCRKFLEAKQDNALAVPSTLENLQNLLDYNNVMNLKAPSWDECSADNYFLPNTTFNSLGRGNREAYTWMNTPVTGYPNEWSYIYDVVMYANTVLEKVEGIGRSVSNIQSWSNVKGSALFFRSFSFYRALSLFSPAYDSSEPGKDLGIVLKETTDINAVSSRSSVTECYNKVTKDLRESCRLLPDKAIHVMRPSKAAAYGLLSRVYLSMRRYDSSYLYADSSLLLAKDLVDYNAVATGTTATPFARFNTEVVFHSATQSYSYSAASVSYARVDTVLLRAYSSNDLRKALFFTAKTDGTAFRGSYAGSANYLFSGVATDETVLNKAESAARIGKTTEAASLMDTLLTRRYKKGTYHIFPTNLSPDMLIDTILMERRKELLFRGLRWTDLKRLNKEGKAIRPSHLVNGVYYSLEPNSSQYLMPIPQTIVQTSGMPQNPT